MTETEGVAKFEKRDPVDPFGVVVRHADIDELRHVRADGHVGAPVVAALGPAAGRHNTISRPRT